MVEAVFTIEIVPTLAVLDGVGLLKLTLVAVAPVTPPLRLVTIDVGTGPVLEAVDWTIEAVLEIEFDVTLAVLMRVGELVDDRNELLPL